MIAIVDYGAGNIFSVKNALDYLELESILTADAKEIENADAVILPGVGAFPAAMNKLYESGLTEVVRTEAKKSLFWVFVLVCRCYLKKAVNLVNPKDWDLFPEV